MNESIKFTKDAPNGAYAKNDTGTMVSVAYTPFAGITAVVRLEDGKYATAPVSHVEYDSES